MSDTMNTSRVGSQNSARNGVYNATASGVSSPFSSYFDQLAYSNAIAALGSAFCLSVLKQRAANGETTGDCGLSVSADKFDQATCSSSGPLGSPIKSLDQLRSAAAAAAADDLISTRSHLCTTILSATNCVVCGDVSSGKHYGIYACNGCSGFFKRSVRRKLIYRCQSGTGSCTIDKAHRNSCQACRLRKCLQMGMNKDAVQNERQARNSAQIKDEQVLRNPELASTQAAVSATHPAFLPREVRSASPSDTSQTHSRSHSAKEDPCPSTCNNLPIANACAGELALASPNHLQLQQSNANVTGSLQDANVNMNIGVQQETLNEFATRLLHTAVQWIKSLPSFSCLTCKDQVTLLEKSWSELFLLHVIQWSMPLDSVPLFSVADSFHAQLLSLDDSDSESQSHSQSQSHRAAAAEAREDIAFLQNLFYRVKRLQIDAVEFVCLKSLAVYKADVHGLLDSLLVEQLQEQTLIVLSQHCRSQIAGNSARFGKLLLLMNALREVSGSRLERHLFGYKLKNNPIAKFLIDAAKV